MPAPTALPEIVVCETCRHPDGEREKDGQSGGSIMADLLRTAVANDEQLSGARLTTIRCMMACARHCTVHVRAPGKMGYVLGGFTPEAETVRGLMEYLRAYDRTDDGVVPFRQWPQAVKGRFVARIPALPSAVPESA
jgi:predicted metal-binding protein